MVALLDDASADYATFDILSDNEVRQGDIVSLSVLYSFQHSFFKFSLSELYENLEGELFTKNCVGAGLKKFSNWPTYPQLYVNGELVGGLDILKVLPHALSVSSGRWRPSFSLFVSVSRS